jgi:hypothetical protein
MLVQHAGSHTVLELLKSGYRATVIDNFDNAFEACYERMKKLAGDKADKIKLIKVYIATSLRKHLRTAPFPACHADALVSEYSPVWMFASMQGDLRNFDDVDKALGTDKSVCFVGFQLLPSWTDLPASTPGIGGAIKSCNGHAGLMPSCTLRAGRPSGRACSRRCCTTRTTLWAQ